MTATISTTLVLASIMVGEAGCMPPMSQMAVASTILNRYETNLDAYLGEGFYARDDPTPMSLVLASWALQGADLSGGAKYVLSEEDRRKLGFEEGDIVHEHGKWALHFYWDWPGGKR